MRVIMMAFERLVVKNPPHGHKKKKRRAKQEC
jgi:hypothetical protein